MADPNDDSRDDNTDEREELENDDGSNKCDEMPIEFSFPGQPMALCFGLYLLFLCVVDREMGAILLISLLCLFLVILYVHGFWHLREKRLSVLIVVSGATTYLISLLFLIECVLTPKEISLDVSFLLIPLLLGLVSPVLGAMSAPVNYFKAKMLALQREEEDSQSLRLVGMLKKLSTINLFLMALVVYFILAYNLGASMSVHESSIYQHNPPYFGWFVAVGFLGLCSVFYLFAMIHFAGNELEIPLLPEGDKDPAPGFANSDPRARTRNVLQIV